MADNKWAESAAVLTLISATPELLGILYSISAVQRNLHCFLSSNAQVVGEETEGGGQEKKTGLWRCKWWRRRWRRRRREDGDRDSQCDIINKIIMLLHCGWNWGLTASRKLLSGLHKMHISFVQLKYIYNCGGGNQRLCTVARFCFRYSFLIICLCVFVMSAVSGYHWISNRISNVSLTGKRVGMRPN